MDKSGKLRKKIDKYFLPLEINPNIILDIIRQENQKNSSPAKMKTQALNKISEQSKKFDLLRVTGRQLNSNFAVGNQKGPKAKASSKQLKQSPQKQKQISKQQLTLILSEPINQLIQNLRQDSEAPQYQNQLEELINSIKQNKSQFKIKSDRIELCASMILCNNIMCSKLMSLYQKLKNQKQDKIDFHEQNKKRPSMSEGPMNKRVPKYAFKKAVMQTQKQLAPHELKRLNNYIQYREFLMAINLTNKVVIFPQEGPQKAFICKGNNGLLVKSILKSRPWWTIRASSDIDTCNLVWSQWKKSKMTNSLPCRDNKVQRSSFYVNNYYDKINHGSARQLTEGQLVQQKQGRSKIGLNDEIFRIKTQQISRIMNLINYQEIDSSYFNFTRKINEKKFEEICKKYLPSHPSYYVYNQMNKPKDKPAMVILNHLPGCLQLHSKKLLYLNMKKYYQRNNKEVFEYLPETHLIKDGVADPSFEVFVQRWKELEAERQQPGQKSKTKNIWICKPGQNSNRGNGITVVSTVEQVRELIKSMNSVNRTLIVQKYMENPYLYNKRKFDIRCYLLITTVNGVMKGYFYNEGYIRTTSKEYNLKNLDNKFVHLTNDAIQKKGEEYGKFESCNKVSFAEFQKYLESNQKQQANKFINARKQIKQMVIDIVNAVSNKLNPSRKQFCFQLFGLDFMLDCKMKPYLIEANSNPCLEVDGSVLAKIIPSMVENAIRIAIDPLFPPPYSQNWRTSRFSPGNAFQHNKFQVVYDSLDDPNAKEIGLKPEDVKELLEEEDEYEKQAQNQIEE